MSEPQNANHGADTTASPSSGAKATGGSKNRLVAILIVALALAGVSLAFRRWTQPEDQDYKFKAPPVSSNAKGDPPNPDKIKRLPGPDGSSH